ncbi:MAG: NAD(P)-binding protein [Oscillibacter sp.]|nr:NAD(P)-binding protein [Oscillibacter sp.]
MEHDVASNEIELRCLHGKEPPCSSACPFSLNIRDFLGKLKKGSFHGAFNLYREAVGFPALVWQICPAPCGNACRTVLEQAVDMPALEQASMAYARSTAPVQYNLPEKKERIAIVGAGLSGLSCARRLAVLNYSVSVFEKKDRICSELEETLPREKFEPAVLQEFQFTSCQFHTGHPVEHLSELEFDAVYLSSGVSLREEDPRVFRAPEGLSPVEALAEGTRAADAIEWFLKTGRKKPLQMERSSGEEAAPLKRRREPLSKGEARQEAARCTRCDCSACMQECVLLRQYGQTPRDLSKDVGLALNVFPETQGRAGMREIGACNFCGLCKTVCPSQIDIGAFLLRSRTELCSKGLLPPAHHEYWLRDMAFSNGPQAAYFYQPQAVCSYLFFPGCQSGGSDPRYVTMTYEKLLSKYPETALLLRCCGAPALWAGEAEAFAREHEMIRGFWERAGKPVVLVSCPSCYRVFREYMPDIPVKIVYELLEIEPKSDALTAAVFDPCSSRDFPEIQSVVRSLVSRSGIPLEELKYAKGMAQCCSWGGHGYAVNPVVVKTQAAEQAEQSDLPYITYCTNCRDIFSSRGKSCRHILDLICGINDGLRRPPTATERRNNRRALKRALLTAYPTGETQEREEHTMLKLEMEERVAARMSGDLILEEDLAQAIETCEKESRYLVDLESGHRICHLKIGYVTYWVEYAPSGEDVRTVYNAYSHRMTIKAEYGAE